MNTLFKYSSYIEDFFKKPSIKLSNIQTLNDPFESEISSHVIERIAHNLEHHQKGSSKQLDIIDIDTDTLKTFVSYNGIVSLSETPRNLLMWAHYGNQHNGMCVGFNKNVLNYLPHKNKFKDANMGVYKPIKVNCDNDRIDPKKISKAKSILKDILISYLTTKSDEWIYEKEHRSIISFYHAHEIIVPEDLNIPLVYSGNVPSLELINILVDEGKIIKKRKNVYKLLKDKIDDTDCSMLSLIPNSSMLIHINPKYIESVYFGCRVTYEKLKKTYDTIHGNKKTDHIVMYHYTLSATTFSLKPNIVTPKYLEELEILYFSQQE